MTHKKTLIALLLSFGLAGCSFPSMAKPTPTPTETVLPSPSATASPTPNPTATFTPAPTATPTIMPTIEPLTGIVQAPSNIRSRDSKGGGDRLGGILFNQSVMVIGRNPAANWYYIIYPDSPTGTAWILARAVKLQGEMERLPIVAYAEGSDIPVMLPPIIYQITGTPQLPSTPLPGAAAAATVNQYAFVRVGPGLGYLTVGTVERAAVLTLTGRTKGNVWLQFDYPSGLEGHAWISSDLVTIEGNTDNVPLFNDLATPVADDPGLPALPAQTGGDSASPAATPLPEGPQAIVTAQINVRLGPAQKFDALGMLNKDNKVVLTGQTISGYWYQIDYPDSPNGLGWVASKYIRVIGDIRNLPYFDNEGNPVPTPAP